MTELSNKFELASDEDIISASNDFMRDIIAMYGKEEENGKRKVLNIDEFMDIKKKGVEGILLGK